MTVLSAENFKYFFIRRRTTRIVIFLSLLLWCFGFIFTSLFSKSPAVAGIIFYPLLKQVYSAVCHQTSYKSFEINGINFLVCARCSGIYFGALLGSLFFIFSNKNIPIKIDILFISAAPMLFDVIFYSTGIYYYSKVIALATGLIFGGTAIGFILHSIENYFKPVAYPPQAELKEHIKD